MSFISQKAVGILVDSLQDHKHHGETTRKVFPRTCKTSYFRKIVLVVGAMGGLLLFQKIFGCCRTYGCQTPGWRQL